MGKNAHLSSVKYLIVSVLLITPMPPIRMSAVLDASLSLNEGGSIGYVQEKKVMP